MGIHFVQDFGRNEVVDDVTEILSLFGTKHCADSIANSLNREVRVRVSFGDQHLCLMGV